MPRGAYTSKQDRKAEHIEEGYEKRGVSEEEAEAWKDDLTSLGDDYFFSLNRYQFEARRPAVG